MSDILDNTLLLNRSKPRVKTAVEKMMFWDIYCKWSSNKGAITHAAMPTGAAISHFLASAPQ